MLWVNVCFTTPWTCLLMLRPASFPLQPRPLSRARTAASQPVTARSTHSARNSQERCKKALWNRSQSLVASTSLNKWELWQPAFETCFAKSSHAEFTPNDHITDDYCSTCKFVKNNYYWRSRGTKSNHVKIWSCKLPNTLNKNIKLNIQQLLRFYWVTVPIRKSVKLNK